MKSFNAQLSAILATVCIGTLIGIAISKMLHQETVHGYHVAIGTLIALTGWAFLQYFLLQATRDRKVYVFDCEDSEHLILAPRISVSDHDEARKLLKHIFSKYVPEEEDFVWIMIGSHNFPLRYADREDLEHIAKKIARIESSEAMPPVSKPKQQSRAAPPPPNPHTPPPPRQLTPIEQQWQQYYLKAYATGDQQSLFYAKDMMAQYQIPIPTPGQTANWH